MNYDNDLYVPTTQADLDRLAAKYPQHAGSWGKGNDVETVELMRIMLRAWGEYSERYTAVVPWRREMEGLFPERYVSKWHILCAAAAEGIALQTDASAYFLMRWKPKRDVFSRVGQFKAEREFALITGQPERARSYCGGGAGAIRRRQDCSQHMRTLAEQRAVRILWPR